MRYIALINTRMYQRPLLRRAVGFSMLHYPGIAASRDENEPTPVLQIAYLQLVRQARIGKLSDRAGTAPRLVSGNRAPAVRQCRYWHFASFAAPKMFGRYWVHSGQTRSASLACHRSE